MRRALATSLPVLAIAAALAPAAAGASRTIPVIAIPLELRGSPAPSPAALRAMIRRADRVFSRNSGGRVRLRGAVAAPFPAGRFQTGRVSVSPAAYAVALESTARRTPIDGAIPVFVIAYPQFTGDASFSGAGQAAVLVGRQWRSAHSVAHELGHSLGLLHARSPGCRAPLRPASCRETGPGVAEYGDPFDVMGTDAGWFGASSRVALGLGPPTVAPPRGRSASIAIRPAEGGRPTSLRVRADGRDWWIESRTQAIDDGSGRRVRAPRGVVISRAAARLVPDAAGEYPNPYRIPSALRRCAIGRGCFDRYLFGPGTGLSVPGAFRLRVLRGTGAPRVRVTWTDRTPPAISVRGARIVRPVGGAAQLELDVAVSARGAGLETITVDQAGVAAAVEAGRFPGLAERVDGAATIRVALGAGQDVAVRAVDGAGNVSAPVAVDLATLASVTEATLAAEPVLGAARGAPAFLRTGAPVRLAGRTDAAFAFADVEVRVRDEIVARIDVGPDGAFAGAWTPSGPGLFPVEVRVPVGREQNSDDLRYSVFAGFVRS